LPIIVDMKIKTTTGETIDTAKLSDKESEVSEAVNQLYEVCRRYNVSMLAKVIVSDNKYIGAQNQMNGPKSAESMAFLFNVLNLYVLDTTNGEFRLVRTGPDEINEDNPFGNE
jgi:diketogulonate reductase-like aldo/keto reductase